MKYAFILYLVCISFTLFAQTYKYDVVKGSKTIGKMTVARTVVDGDERFLVDSDVEIRVLLTFNIKYFMEELFEDGSLVSGNAYNTFNGKMQKQSDVVKNGRGYTINVNGKPHNLPKESIHFSIPRLYYEEPVGRKDVFSQQLSAYLPIVKKEGRVYEVDSDDGLNIYHYNEKGRCVEVRVIRPIANFSFLLRE